MNSYNRKSLEQTLDIISDIAVQTQMYYFRCTKESDAVTVLEKRLEEQIYGPAQPFEFH